MKMLKSKLYQKRIEEQQAELMKSEENRKKLAGEAKFARMFSTHILL